MGLNLVSSNSDDEVEYTTVVTSRQSALLRTMLETLADDAYDDVELYGSRAIAETDAPQLLDLLPELTWGQNRQWRRRIARAFDDLVADLDASGVPTPTCTAEEMALHLALDRAEAAHTDRSGAHLIEHLPQQPADRNWPGLREDLFEDHDVLLMFDMVELPAEDGEYGLLRPENWFEPFAQERARAADRGYRR